MISHVEYRYRGITNITIVHTVPFYYIIMVIILVNCHFLSRNKLKQADDGHDSHDKYMVFLAFKYHKHRIHEHLN